VIVKRYADSPENTGVYITVEAWPTPTMLPRDDNGNTLFETQR